MLVDYHNRVVDLRKSELRDVASFTVRWAENAYRVALVLHAGLQGADAHNHPIHGETAASAIRIIQWFEAELLQILSKGRRCTALHSGVDVGAERRRGERWRKTRGARKSAA
jgi:hypothetical protein